VKVSYLLATIGTNQQQQLLQSTKAILQVGTSLKTVLKAWPDFIVKISVISL
jgi:hypothetical protein